MEAVTAFQSSLSIFNSDGRSTPAISFSRRPNLVRFGSVSAGLPIQHSLSQSSLGLTKTGFGRRRFTVACISVSSDSSGSADQIAPLQLNSPVGQFLSELLVSHPHIVSAAVEQQLQQLQIDRDAEEQKEDPSATGTDLVLYRRIAEVKNNERRKALEEILYALVVQKFMDSKVSLIPTIGSESSEPVDSWPAQDEKLEQLHSSEAYEMIQNHLALILGNRLNETDSVAHVSKLKVGQVYAASVMYGYFLKRVDQRFQLEKTMKILPPASNGVRNNVQRIDLKYTGGDASSQPVNTHPEVAEFVDGDGIKASRLRNYVMSFDMETLQRYATIRSNEAVSIVEKQTEALFGRPEVVTVQEGTIDSSKDVLIKISFGGLKRLFLEAVTFGTFLWDVETYVDSRYHFVAN